MRNKSFLAWTSFFLFASTVLGQEALPSDTFTVVKAYRPTIVDAKKIDFQIEIEDTFKLETKLNYDFLQKKVPVSFSVEPIAAARIKGEPLVKLYRGYARIGLGNALLPMAEFHYSSLRSKNMAWGVDAKYFNMDEVNDIEGSDRSRGHLEVFGKRFWKANTFQAKLRYELDQLNYYGHYNILRLPDFEVPSSDLEQNYNRFNADFELKSTVRDSFNLRHQAELHYGLTNNEGGGNENHFRGRLNLSQFNRSEFYELELLVDHNQYDFDQSPDNTLLGLKPQVSTIGERFKVKVGLGLYLNDENDADFHFYPLAEVKYNVIEDVLIPYAGLNGEIKKRTYGQFSLENPFLMEELNLRNSNQKFRIYTGLRGTLSSKLSFNLSGSFKRTEDDYFYVQLLDENRLMTKDFQLTYDEVDESSLKGEFIYRHSKALEISGKAEYFSFDVETIEEAWHRPEVKVNVSAEYNLRDKIILRADLFYWGEQKARGVNGEIQNNQILNQTFQTNTLDDIFDANLGIEYRYTKRLSAFINFNNIGGVNFEKYQNYPLQGFNVWGGVTYGF